MCAWICCCKMELKCLVCDDAKECVCVYLCGVCLCGVWLKSEETCGWI